MGAAMSELDTLRANARDVGQFVRRVGLVGQYGAKPGGVAQQALELAVAATRELAAIADMVKPRTDERPQDGTPFWATGDSEDAEIKLVRFGIIPGRERFGKVLHTVEDEVWLSDAFYTLWWPMDFFPVEAKNPTEKKRK